MTMSDTCYCNTTANMFMLALVSISMNLVNIIIIIMNIALPASSIIMGMGIVVSAGVSVRIIHSLG